ncbi:hypothetical protein F9L16_17635 [Agarivorans sp. B2Z047]|uniref:hypothetical protein n=1 Tax=Agarivorans sp. B2Z047 TaxID=2652721 RepID=UPI00128B191B|nr:hypothetical protein [Agarivorans sp. B2Z047]MPW30811.1 hypothetical protein [Agarivorans sp. B2Z047]UQN40959.1 hypothetical protein LQZ07_14375 [Agarivorans sp. B2Z047]
MKFMNLKISLIMFFFLFAMNATAIEISSMLNVANSNGEGVFTIKNTTDERIFLNVGMHELHIDDEGEIHKNAYTRNNVEEWKIEVRPARTVIAPGFEKDIKVSLSCLPDCDLSKDHVFQLAFVPTPYVESPTDESKTVQMAVGFAPLFIVPTENARIDYEASYKDDTLYLHNKADSYLTLKIDGCGSNGPSSSCIQNATLLGGRSLKLKLREEVQKEKLEVSAKLHGRPISHTQIIERE